jgi:outer membrane immunogenic protein
VGLFNIVPIAAVTQYRAKIDWFGTVRGRVGFLPNDQLLIYATVGLAYGEVGVSGNATIDSLLVVVNPVGFSASKTNVGFAVGAGMEGRLTGWLPANWTWKLEYIHLDLGSLNTAVQFQPTTNVQGLVAPVAVNMRTHFTNDIVRVGINYQFR